MSLFLLFSCLAACLCRADGFSPTERSSFISSLKVPDDLATGVVHPTYLDSQGTQQSWYLEGDNIELSRAKTISSKRHHQFIDERNLDDSISALYRKRAKSDLMDQHSLRLALKDVRVKMPETEIASLVRQYDLDAGGSLTLEDFRTFIQKQPLAIFWLSFDPSGLLRRNLQKYSKLASAGLASFTRAAHSIPGVASLLIGTADVARMTCYGMTDALPSEISQGMSILHCSVALTSLFRFDWKGFPFHGHEPQRRNVLAVASFISVFLCGLQFTEFGCEKPIMLLESLPAQVFEGFSAILAACLAAASYSQGGSTDKKTGLPGEMRLENMLVVALPMLLALLPELFFATKISTTMGIGPYKQLAEHYPSYIPFSSNSHNILLFVNNLLSFLSTAVHYQIISNENVKKFNNFFGIVIFCWMVKEFIGIGDGFFQEWVTVYYLG